MAALSGTKRSPAPPPFQHQAALLSPPPLLSPRGSQPPAPLWGSPSCSQCPAEEEQLPALLPVAPLAPLVALLPPAAPLCPAALDCSDHKPAVLPVLLTCGAAKHRSSIRPCLPAACSDTRLFLPFSLAASKDLAQTSYFMATNRLLFTVDSYPRGGCEGLPLCWLLSWAPFLLLVWGRGRGVGGLPRSLTACF